MFFNRLWRSRLNIPRRAFWFFITRLIQRLNLFKLDPEVQSRQMQTIGLRRTEGLARLNEILRNALGRVYDERDGMFSEHLVLLASISIARTDIKRILEIGSFDGRTALILSRLYPEAQIVTIDLPSDEVDFKQTYDRQDSIEEFKTRRDSNIRKSGNVEFREVNSLNLSEWEDRFDLIWIDGDHGYPLVAMDIINSFRLANTNAFVLIDDIWKRSDTSDTMYKSVGGFESLNALVKAKLISEYFLFPKRLGGLFNYPGQKKYVGFFKK
jgi:predicted O-methyltransferase YrrM